MMAAKTTLRPLSFLVGLGGNLSEQRYAALGVWMSPAVMVCFFAKFR